MHKRIDMEANNFIGLSLAVNFMQLLRQRHSKYSDWYFYSKGKLYFVAEHSTKDVL